MLTTGPNLGLLDNGEYGEGNYRELLRLFRGLDTLVQPHVKSASTVTPPISPSEGDAYVIPSGATGLWVGHDGHVARWTARSGAAVKPAWEFFTPKVGWMFAIESGGRVEFDGTSWITFGTGGSLQQDSLVASVVAGEALGGHRMVVLDSNSQAIYADQSNPAHFGRVFGMTTGAVALGASVNVLRDGPIDEPSWSWDTTKPVFLGTNGLLTQSVPTSGFQHVVGVPITTTRLVLHLREPLVLS